MTSDVALLSIKDAADRCDVSVSTVRRWARFGLIRSVRLPSGRMRVPLADLDEMMTPRYSERETSAA